MRRTWTCLMVSIGIGLMAQAVRAAEPEPQPQSLPVIEVEPAPWNYAPCDKDKACEIPFSPPMLGDQLQGGFNLQGGFQGQFGGQFGQFGGQFNVGFNLQSGFQGGLQAGQLQFGGSQFQGGFAVVVARGAEKMSENDSPRPQNRVFGNYNYYNNVHNVLDVHRETIGFELAVLEGRASVGLRLPFFQDRGDGGFSEGDPGDLGARFKYALINNPNSVLSVGLAVTAPTGPIPTVAILRETGELERVHPWQLQPFVGYLWSPGGFYVHGFSSVQIPTDSRDVTMLYNDIGIGYWLYRGGGILRAIIPTVEVHINTPLTHRESTALPRFVDSVDLTGGSHFLLGNRFSVGLGFCVPVTGPKLFDFEALANVNWRF